MLVLISVILFLSSTAVGVVVRPVPRATAGASLFLHSSIGTWLGRADSTTEAAPSPSCTEIPCELPEPSTSNASTSCIDPPCPVPGSYPEAAANLTTGFVSPPNGRGTLGIAWSCLFTLYASFWTILHVNVPGEDDKWTTVLFRKIKWMAITAIAPEYTYLVATGQRSVAAQSLKQLERAMEMRGEDSKPHHPWSLTHAFFADMGGIRLRSLAQKRSVYVSTADIVVLVHSGLIEKVPSISKEEIDARSKSDSFAKIVACLQFLWLGIQCAARTAQQLPITQLELITLLDAICAVMTYVAWFSKPYDLSAAAVQYIDVESITEEMEDSIVKVFNHNRWTLKIARPPATGRSQDQLEKPRIHHRAPNAFAVAATSEKASGPRPYYAHNSSGDHEQSNPGNTEEDNESDSRADDYESRDDGDRGDGRDNEANDNESSERGRIRGGVGSGADNNSIYSSAVSDYSSDLSPSSRFRVNLLVVVPWIVTVGICVTFGALHCLMWHRDFPTIAEQIIWRVASVLATAAVPAYLLVWLTQTPGLGSVTLLFFLASYAVARLYLIVEAFVSLRMQPSAVYDDVEWSMFFPHF